MAFVFAWLSICSCPINIPNTGQCQRLLFRLGIRTGVSSRSRQHGTQSDHGSRSRPGCIASITAPTRPQREHVSVCGGAMSRRTVDLRKAERPGESGAPTNEEVTVTVESYACAGLVSRDHVGITARPRVDGASLTGVRCAHDPSPRLRAWVRADRRRVGARRSHIERIRPLSTQRIDSTGPRQPHCEAS